ncbi:RNase H domain-containing protein [Trichonephila clavipes]|nr:RNase H domain-containing protein [Trichonephila clavipes]
MDNIGSDYLTILVEIDLNVNCNGVKNPHWNFKKADWSLFENISNNLISQEPISENLEKEWSHFKHSIFTAAKSSIPIGKSKQTRTFFAHNSDLIKTLISQRTELLEVISQNVDLDKKIELNKLKAEIKKIYVQVKRSNWQNLCEKLDYGTSNTKLRKLAKQIDNLKPSNEETNAIIIDNGHVSVDAREAADALAQYYVNESRLAFSSYDKHFARVTRNQVKSSRDRPADNPLFNVDFTLPELSYALQNLDTVKPPGPDSIPGHFLSHLGILGREILLYICNLSWKTTKTVEIGHRYSHSQTQQECRSIFLICITCKLMECMVLRRFTHHLHTNNLMPRSNLLFCSDANISKMESQLNRSLVKIQEFADNHKITFNASKSTVSLFTTNRHLYNYSPEIFLMSEQLNYSKFSTYLGFTLDSEVNCRKHIEKIADKARKKLKILEYLSGRDWDSDASTLRITYATLVRPVLEYGYQIFQLASPTNLKKLERVQLSAAKIITGLRYSCPTDIVLYEEDLQPLTMRFEVNS